VLEFLAVIGRKMQCCKPEVTLFSLLRSRNAFSVKAQATLYAAYAGCVKRG